MRFLVYVLCGVLLAPTVWASDTAPSTKNGQVNTEEFHISPAYLPDHQIGESGPLIMDTTERKTTRYSNVDAVNSAINAVAVSNINNDMHTNGKAWMKRTTVALSFQKDWKPLYSAETVQPIGHYDDQSRQVWFTKVPWHALRTLVRPLTAVLAIAASAVMTIICMARTCFMTTVSRANIDA